MSKEKVEQIKNTPEEESLVNLITNNQKNAESARGTDYSESGTYISDLGIDQVWEDESKMLIGDQWTTSIAYRTKAVRKTRPNSVNNFIFPAITNIVANITSSDPEVTIEGTEESDKEVSEKLTFLSRFNDQRNKFPATWKKMVQQFVAYGPIIGAVLWDSDWIGGTGPNRWLGDVRIIYIDRRTIYFDPAITDLEERLQECSFIHRKYRKKLDYIKDRWEKGKFVSEDNNDMDLQYEGQDPKQVWLIESRHRELPKFMPEKRRRELLEKAAEFETIDPFKAQEYKDMAAGKLKGVHVAYVANGVLLEYMPYEYDDGLYPVVYKVCYFDENTPHGFGEVRNIKVPQILHNKADEIEIEAMSREGLGGKLYNDGAVTDRQLENILKHQGKGGAWLKVNNVNQLADRDGVKTPAALVGYKEHKQRMVETISQNTPIQQGMAPSANMPYRAIAELGARTDIRTKHKVKILEDFLIELNKLRINRFVQFYTEDRYYRLKGQDNKVVEGTFKNEELMRSWDRDMMDDDGNITESQQETFVPEFDISVKIMGEKPTDRNYYTNTALELFGKQAIDLESLWYTLEEGKFPQSKEILERLTAQNEALQMSEVLKQVPPEMKQQFMQAQQGMLQQMTQGGMMQGAQGGDVDSFLDGLPDDVFQMIQAMPQEEQEQHIQGMMQMQPEELQAHIEQMRQGMM
jgi:hypothetical protein